MNTNPVPRYFERSLPKLGVSSAQRVALQRHLIQAIWRGQHGEASRIACQHVTLPFSRKVLSLIDLDEVLAATLDPPGSSLAATLVAAGVCLDAPLVASGGLTLLQGAVRDLRVTRVQRLVEVGVDCNARQGMPVGARAPLLEALHGFAMGINPWDTCTGPGSRSHRMAAQGQIAIALLSNAAILPDPGLCKVRRQPDRPPTAEKPWEGGSMYMLSHLTAHSWQAHAPLGAQLVAALLGRGALPNPCDPDNCRDDAIHNALAMGNHHFVVALARAGADLSPRALGYDLIAEVGQEIGASPFCEPGQAACAAAQVSAALLARAARGAHAPCAAASAESAAMRRASPL